ncbi:MAG: 3-methyl-2-oxobutanoate hydroxymethyltransferase, partial [Candidatus Omnitrophota bacterium]
GDSLANVVLGLDSTKDVNMQQMLHHTEAVAKAVSKALVVGDMPYCAYQVDANKAVANAKQFIAAGADAVKVEWFDGCLEVVDLLISSGISVMGHIGLTPQRAQELGGFKVQGKSADAARGLIEQALLLEKKGVFSIVLECVPDCVAQIITEKLLISTIGIGAGPFCDGQVLVINDILGLSQNVKPKFIKQYCDLTAIISKAVLDYKSDIELCRFPAKEHCYSMPDEELRKLSDTKI